MPLIKTEHGCVLCGLDDDFSTLDSRHDLVSALRAHFRIARSAAFHRLHTSYSPRLSLTMVMRSLLTEDRSSLKIGSCCCGIPIALHYSYFLLLLIELAASARYLDAAFSLFMLTLYGPVLLLTIVLHELGHCWMTRKLGGDVGGIVLWPLGGFAMVGPTDCGTSGDFRVAIAGPLTHIPQMIFWVAMFAAFGGNFSQFSMSYYLAELSDSAASFFVVLSQTAFWTNLFILAFNLFVPAYPLDGGRCLAAYLIMRGYRMEKTALIVSVTAMVLSGGLLLFGMISFIYMHSPNGIYMALVSAYIFSSSMNLFNLQKEGRVREHPLFSRGVFEEREIPEVQQPDEAGAPASPPTSPKAEDAEMA